MLGRASGQQTGVCGGCKSLTRRSDLGVVNAVRGSIALSALEEVVRGVVVALVPCAAW